MVKKQHQIGLWIDGDILHLPIPLKEKVILSDIMVLSTGTNSCFKLNSTFASTYSMSVRTVQVVLASLTDRGLINITMTRPYDNPNKTQRIIRPNYANIKKFVKDNKPK